MLAKRAAVAVLAACAALLAMAEPPTAAAATSTTTTTTAAPADVRAELPLAVNTWPFREATAEAYAALRDGARPLDAIVRGCGVCERLQCDGSVGYGGSPDEAGETTLDAMVMDGDRMAVGAVGCLREVKNAVGVAAAVLRHTQHSLLVGELATRFAVSMGFRRESLATNRSAELWRAWVSGHCQPNFWRPGTVVPDPSRACGPYAPTRADQPGSRTGQVDRASHDTIGMVAIARDGSVASGTSTNGLNHKIPGRVGDSPIAGAGSYADSTVGGCAATGDGDVMMRFLPSLIGVEQMRAGRSATEAAETAVRRIIAYYPAFTGAIVCATKAGAIGAAGHGWTFSYTYQGAGMPAPVTVSVPPITRSS